MRLLAIVLLVCVSLACSHCGCTQELCISSVAIIIDTSTGEWEPGEYTMDLSDDDNVRHCTFSIPSAQLDGEERTAIRCGIRMRAWFEERTQCSNESGAACPPPGFYMYVPVYGYWPNTASLRLERDGVLIIEEERPFTYSPVFGGGCDSRCRNSRANFLLP
jgi:hypothetical protein